MKRPINKLYFKGYYEVAKASDYLSSVNIPNEIVRAPIRQTGCCGFTIAVNPEDEQKTISILSVANYQKR